MLMVEQSLIWLPALASIARLEQCGRLDTTVENVGFGSPARRDLPDLGESAP
jgi:hypothetical protein